MRVFVTGGTGFVGRHVLARLTALGHRVDVLMRAPGAFSSLQARIDALGGRGAALTAVAGDLSRPGLGLATNLSPPAAVIHLGAAFGWGLDREFARRTNVDGALAAAGLARQYGARLIMVSGFMLENRPHLAWLGIVPGDTDGTDWARVYSRAGAYEASKIEAALRVRDYAARHGVGLVEVQPATVSGHSESGELDSAQPLYNLIENLAGGRLALVPGTPAHWLPLVSVDALSELIATAAGAEDVPPRLLALDAHTPNLMEMLGMLAVAIGRPAPRRYISMGLLRALLRIPGLARLTNTAPESLHFLQPARFDTSVTDAFRKRHNLQWPPVTDSLSATAKLWLDQAV